MYHLNEEWGLTLGYIQSKVINLNSFEYFTVPNQIFKITNNKVTFLKSELENFPYLYSFFHRKRKNNFFSCILPLSTKVGQMVVRKFILIDVFDQKIFNFWINKAIELNVFQIEIHFSNEISFDKIKTLLDYNDVSSFTQIILVVKFINKEKNFFHKIISKYPNLNRVIFFSSIINKLDNILLSKIVHYRDDYNVLINQTPKFHYSKELLNTSENFNSYFYGNIFCNYQCQFYLNPLSPKDYLLDAGSINSIEQLIEYAYFFWTVPKKNIISCRVCEHQTFCKSSNIPELINENVYNLTPECNYNPYIAKWKGEEGYRTLAECGVTSNEHGFSIDHERIAKINEELWGGDE